MACSDLLIVMGDMNARVGNDTDIGARSLVGMVRMSAMRMGRDFYSLVVSTTFGFTTHGSHIKEYTSTPGSVEAKGSGLSLTTS